MFRGSQKKEPPKEDLFDIDLEHGTLKRKIDGTRVAAMGSIGWATIEKELRGTFISGAAVILQRMGYSYGTYLGRHAKSLGQTPEQTFESLQNFAKESGWGDMILSGGDLLSGQARIVVKGCFFCVHIRDSTEPVCNMLVGLVGGVADEMIGQTHRVQEERCIAKGDAVCEISVERLG